MQSQMCVMHPSHHNMHVVISRHKTYIFDTIHYSGTHGGVQPSVEGAAANVCAALHIVYLSLNRALIEP